MTTTKLTIETATRDPAELAKEGRFNLRCLAQESGFFDTEESKQSFMSLDVADQAKALATRFQEIDKKKGGKGSKAPANSAAVAPATNGAARTPSNKGTKATTTAASTESAPAGAGAERLIAAMEEMSAKVGELSDKIDLLAETVGTQQSHIAGTNKLTTLSISLMLLFAEQVLNASSKDVLTMAIAELEGIETTVQSELGIDVPKTEEAGGDDDTGNE